MSQVIHNIFFNEKGIDGSYSYYEMEESMLGDTLNRLETQGLKGLNVTIPYKILVKDHLDNISKEAEAIGSINTIKFANGKREGYNTDYSGFGMLLEHFSLEPKGRSCIVLGTGGASRAVVKLLEDKGAETITLVSRNKNLKPGVKNTHEIISYEELNERTYLDILVNTTPVGMYPDVSVSPVSRDTVKKARAVVDVIYNPEETTLLKYAREEKIAGVNGLYMLVGQAIAAQEIWNDCTYDADLVDRIHDRLKLYLEVQRNG